MGVSVQCCHFLMAAQHARKVVFHVRCRLLFHHPAFCFPSPWRVEKPGTTLQNTTSKHTLLEQDLLIGEKAVPRSFASSFFCSSMGFCWSGFPIYFLMGALTGVPCSPPPSLLHLLDASFMQSGELSLCLISQQLRNIAIWISYVKKKKNWKEKDFLLNYSPPSP